MMEQTGTEKAIPRGSPAVIIFVIASSYLGLITTGRTAVRFAASICLFFLIFAFFVKRKGKLDEPKRPIRKGVLPPLEVYAAVLAAGLSSIWSIFTREVNVVNSPSADDIAYRSLAKYVSHNSWNFWTQPQPEIVSELWSSIHHASGLRVGDVYLRLMWSIFTHDPGGSTSFTTYKWWIIAFTAWLVARYIVSPRVRDLRLIRQFIAYSFVGISCGANGWIYSLSSLNAIAALTSIPFCVLVIIFAWNRDRFWAVLASSALIFIYPEIGIVFWCWLVAYGFRREWTEARVGPSGIVPKLPGQIILFMPLLIGSPAIMSSVLGALRSDSYASSAFASPLTNWTVAEFISAVFGVFPDAFIELFGTDSTQLTPTKILGAVAFLLLARCVVLTKTTLIVVLLSALWSLVVATESLPVYWTFRLTSIVMPVMFLTLLLPLLIQVLVSSKYSGRDKERWTASSRYLKILPQAQGIGALLLLSFGLIGNVNMNGAFNTRDARVERSVDSSYAATARTVNNFNGSWTIAVREYHEQAQILISLNQTGGCNLLPINGYLVIPACDAPQDGLLVVDRLAYVSGNVDDYGRFKVLNLGEGNSSYAIPSVGWSTPLTNDPSWFRAKHVSDVGDFLVGGSGAQPILVCLENSHKSEVHEHDQITEQILVSGTQRFVDLERYSDSSRVELELNFDSSEMPLLLQVSAGGMFELDRC